MVCLFAYVGLQFDAEVVRCMFSTGMDDLSSRCGRHLKGESAVILNPRAPKDVSGFGALVLRL